MEDGRKDQRCTIHWRSAIGVTGTGGPQTLQCKTNDVSAGGVSVICPLNIFPDSEVTVYLLLDPGSATHPQLVFEAQGKVMNNVLSSKQGGFRLGIEFTKFVGDSKQLLKKHLPRDLVKPKRLVTSGSALPPGVLAPHAETPAAASEQTSAADVAPPADAGQGAAAHSAAGEIPPEGEIPARPDP